MNLRYKFALLGAMALLISACQSTDTVETAPEPEMESTPAATPVAAAPRTAAEIEADRRAEMLQGVGSIVYFEFDQSTLTPESRSALLQHAAYLRTNSLSIVLEGQLREWCHGREETAGPGSLVLKAADARHIPLRVSGDLDARCAQPPAGGLVNQILVVAQQQIDFLLAGALERLMSEYPIPPQNYWPDEGGRWEEWVIDEAGFGVELFAEVHRVTGDPRMRELGRRYTEQHVALFGRPDGLWHRQVHLDGTPPRPTMRMTRGLAWPMEGLLAAHRLLPEGGIYLEQARKINVSRRETAGSACFPRRRAGSPARLLPLASI
mgnify:CR=1 FL=1